MGIFFGLYKTRHILLSDSANCTVLRAVVLTQYRGVRDGRTDRQRTGGETDGIAVASTALAMRALRRAVKTANSLSNVVQAKALNRQKLKQEGQHPLTGQRAASFRLLANQ